MLDVLRTDVAAILMDGGAPQVEAIAALAPRVVEVLDQLNEQFVKGCLVNPDNIDFEQVTCADIELLFAAALELNPLEVFLDREKNSPAGALAQQLMKSLGARLPVLAAPAPGGTNTPDPAGPGTSVTSPDYYDPAATASQS